MQHTKSWLHRRNRQYCLRSRKIRLTAPSTAWLKFVYRPGVQRMSGGSIEKEEEDCQIEDFLG
jgi:hypothetical protein